VTQQSVEQTRPFDLPRWAPWTAFGVVALIVAITLGGPVALLNSHLPYTNDMTGHDWWLEAFRTAWLHGHPLGWSNEINLGYLFGYTYFPLPPMVMTVLAVVLPIAVAIKLMVFLSILSMVVGLWYLVWGWGADRTIQTMVVAATPVALFSNHWVTIGGTLYDTVVGEFSMAFSLGLGLCFLGELSRLQRGVGRWWLAGGWLGGSVLAHLQGALGTTIMAVIFLAFQWRDVVFLRRAAAAIAVGGGLSAWWWLPGLSVSGQTLGDVNNVSHNLASFLLTAETGPLVVVGVLGLGLATWRRRGGAKESLVAVVVISLTLLLPLKIFTAGRVLPLVFWLCVIGVVFLVVEVGTIVRMSPRPRALLLTAVTVIVAVALPLSNGYNRTAAFSVVHLTDAGIQSYPGYSGITALTKALEQLPAGRVMVEAPANYVNLEGDWLWPNLLPLWTNGHDESPEAVFVNVNPSSVAIQYAYENLSESFYSPVIGWQPNPASANAEAGVRQLRVLGVNYFVVETPQLHDQFTTLSGVTLVRTIHTATHLPLSALLSPLNNQGTEWIYRIDGADRAVGVSALTPMPSLPIKPYTLSMVQYLRAEGAGTESAVPVIGLPHAYHGPVNHVLATKVTNSSITLTLAHANEPVLVRESFSPLWHAHGGELYQAEPNEMIVWPHQTTVTLIFQPPVTQIVGLALTVLTGLLVLASSLHGPVRRRKRKGATTPTE